MKTREEILDLLESMHVEGAQLHAGFAEVTFNLLKMRSVTEDVGLNFMPMGYIGTVRSKAHIFISNEAHANEMIVTVGNIRKSIDLGVIPDVMTQGIKDVCNSLMTPELEYLCEAISSICSRLTAHYDKAPQYLPTDIRFATSDFGYSSVPYVSALRSACACFAAKGVLPVDHLGRVSPSYMQRACESIIQKLNKDIGSLSACWSFIPELDAISYSYTSLNGIQTRSYPALLILLAGVLETKLEYVYRNGELHFVENSLGNIQQDTVAIVRAYLLSVK